MINRGLFLGDAESACVRHLSFDRKTSCAEGIDDTSVVLTGLRLLNSARILANSSDSSSR
jgi:hypothetical protein